MFTHTYAYVKSGLFASYILSERRDQTGQMRRPEVRGSGAGIELDKRKPRRSGVVWSTLAGSYYAVGGFPLPLLPISRAPTSLFFSRNGL